MPCPVTLVLLRANRGSGSSVRALLGPEAPPHGCVALRATQSATSLARTQDDGAVAHCIEKEDAPGAASATCAGTQVAPR